VLPLGSILLRQAWLRLGRDKYLVGLRCYILPRYARLDFSGHRMESITAGSMPEGNVDGGWNRHCGQGNSQRTEGKETHKVEGQFYWCPGSQGWVTRAPQTGRPMDPWLISNLSIASRSSLHAGMTRSRQSTSASTSQRMTPTQSSGCSPSRSGSGSGLSDPMGGRQGVLFWRRATTQTGLTMTLPPSVVSRVQSS
jgi:hypothetical protein